MFEVRINSNNPNAKLTNDLMAIELAKRVINEDGYVGRGDYCKHSRLVLEYLGVDFEYKDKHVHYTYPNNYSFSNYLSDNIDLLYQFLPTNRIDDIKTVLSMVQKITDVINKLEKIRDDNNRVILDDNGEIVKDKVKYMDNKFDKVIRKFIEFHIKKIIITNNTNRALIEFINESRSIENIYAMDSRICSELIDAIEDYNDYGCSCDKVHEGFVWTPSDGLLRMIKYMDANRE